MVRKTAGGGRSIPLLFSNKSHPGAVRDENEDYLGCLRIGERHAFLVADGMGGAVAGAVASRTAVEAAEAALRKSPDASPPDLLAEAVAVAHAACLGIQRDRSELQGLGTTLDLVLVEGHRAWWAHVGDGRIYHLRGGGCRQVTTDHTLVQRMVDDGYLAPEEAANHPQRHVLCRALGRGEQVEPDLGIEPLELADGDALVLCSDGLSELVTGAEIARLAESLGPERSCERLVRLALARGGGDNMTVQVVHRGRPRPGWRHRTASLTLEAPGGFLEGRGREEDAGGG